MFAPKTFSERFAVAVFELARREGAATIEWKDLADRVSRVAGRPIDKSTVGRWRDGSEPNSDNLIALAKVLRVDPGWLLLGDATTATPPEWATPTAGAQAAQEPRKRAGERR